MADEKKDEMKEEVKTDEVKVDENKEDEIPQEIMDLNDAFDEKLDSDDDDSTVEDTSGEKKPEEKATEEKDSGEEKKVAEKAAEEKSAVKKTAEEKEIDEQIKIIEAEEKAPVEKKVEKKVDEKVDDEKYDCGLPTEGEEGEIYEPELVKAINKQGQEHQDEIKAQKTENAELRSIIQQQANQRYGDWLDSKFNALGEDFHEAIGQGETEDLEPASDQHENRMKIASRMNVIQKAYVKQDKAVPSRTKLFKRAVSDLFNDIETKSKKEAETVDELAEKAGQTIGSGSTKASALSAEEANLKLHTDFDALLDED